MGERKLSRKERKAAKGGGKLRRIVNHFKAFLKHPRRYILSRQGRKWRLFVKKMKLNDLPNEPPRGGCVVSSIGHGSGALWEWAKKYPDAFLRACAFLGVDPEEVWRPENLTLRRQIAMLLRVKSIDLERL